MILFKVIDLLSLRSLIILKVMTNCHYRIVQELE